MRCSYDSQTCQERPYKKKSNRINRMLLDGFLMLPVKPHCIIIPSFPLEWIFLWKKEKCNRTVKNQGRFESNIWPAI